MLPLYGEFIVFNITSYPSIWQIGRKIILKHIKKQQRARMFSAAAWSQLFNIAKHKIDINN